MPFRGQEPPIYQWEDNLPNPQFPPPGLPLPIPWEDGAIELNQEMHRDAERKAAQEQYDSPIMKNEREQRRSDRKARRAAHAPRPQDYPDNRPHKGPFNNPFGPGPNPPPLGPFPFPNKLPPQQ